MLRHNKPIDMLTPILLAGAPYPYNLENRALYIQGSAGSGKSQVIKQMIHCIRKRGGRDKLIIYDRKPEYLPIFYQDGDVVICPADRRHTPWNLFSEIRAENDLESVINSLFPDLPGTTANEKFWVESAKRVFKAVMVYLMNREEHPSNYDLVKILFNLSTRPKELWIKLRDDPSAAYYAGQLKATEDERTGGGPTPGNVMGSMNAYIGSFTRPEVAERGDFSVKRWLRDPKTDGKALFLANPAKYDAAYKTYFSVILDQLLKEIISIPNDNDRRVWVIIDEFGSLMRLGAIVRLLAEGRSKGACIVLGTQDMAQIKMEYKDTTETLINNCNSKVIARVTSYQEAEMLSKTMGEMEIERDSDSASMQLNGKQGVSLSLNDKTNEARRERRSIVLPSEITSLPDLTYL